MVGKYEIEINEKIIIYFQETLLKWFNENGRDFPWRKKTATNYEIIISEIFLQRTKANTVSSFLPVFFKKYPSWTHLSMATEQELQEILKPIGLFKQRGTRLFKLAQEIDKRKGKLPTERNQVEEISMMGQYITNAYELYILKKNRPLLDINMARLLERVFGPRKLVDIRYDPYLQALSNKIVDIEKSKEINWSILDYAALICKARNPNCMSCLLTKYCQYFICFINK